MLFAHQQMANKSSSAREIELANFKRIALCIQYDGTDFCGWQRQPQGQSIQGTLEEAIRKLDSYLLATILCSLLAVAVKGTSL